ncbi:MAG: hypothetical protein AAF975_08765 [Spirochaetota bacterium]
MENWENWLAARLENGNAWEIAQERELEQMKERVVSLDALLLCFAQKLDDGLGHREIYDYCKMVQEQVDAVLMYRDVAQNWPDYNKKRAQEWIEKALASHQYLTEVLEAESDLFAQKVKKINLPPVQSVYGGNQKAGQLFDWVG